MSITKQRKTYRVVILTAIPVEYEAVRRHLKKVKEERHGGTVYELGSFQGQSHRYRILLAEVGMGNVRSGLGTERAIAQFNPDIILFIGIAGGIKDVKLGDVVVGDKAYNYESGKATRGRFLTRPELGNSTEVILQRAKAEAKKLDWKRRLKGNSAEKSKVVVKPIASGEKVITSTRSATFRLIKSHYNDAIAVDMESNGFFSALHNYPQIQALIIRGISDRLNKKARADSAGYQEIAANHASAFGLEVLYKLKLY